MIGVQGFGVEALGVRVQGGVQGSGFRGSRSLYPQPWLSGLKRFRVWTLGILRPFRIRVVRV